MAFTYQTKSWNIQGEKKLDETFTLLNPTLVVTHITLQGNSVGIGLSATENGGVFKHNLGIQYNNVSGLTDIDVIVDDAIASAFPEAVLNS